MTEPKPAQPPPGLTLNRVMRNVFGCVLLLIGIAGIFLPFVQGVLLIIGGLTLIDVPAKGRAHRKLMRYRWYQRLAKVHDDWLQRWHDWRARRSS